MEKSFVGNIHTRFFFLDKTLRKFKKEMKDKKLLLSYHDGKSFFYYKGEIESDDLELLKNIGSLVSKNYKRGFPRKKALEYVDKLTLPKGTSRINFGVCERKKVITGWNGIANSIWYDDKSPGKIVDVYQQVWTDKRIFDYSKTGLTDPELDHKESILDNLREIKNS